MRQSTPGWVVLLFLALASPALAATFEWKQVNGKWHLTHPVYANQYTGSGNTSIAETYAAMSDTDLRARVTTAGIPPGTSNTNAQAKNAAYYLARRYTETGNTLYAHKAAVLLQRFAEVFPSWPFYDRSGNPYPQSGTPVYYGSMWGSTWYYYDLDQPALQIALAWDIIQDTGQVEALGAGVRQQIETDLIERNVKIYTERYPRGFGNVDGDLIQGVMIWGLVMNDPDVIHKGARWLSEHYRVSWYPSGAWHEAQGSYLLMIGNRLEWAILNNPLKGYSDPPDWTYSLDGTRYDNLNLETELLTPRTNVANVMRNTLLPNGRFAAIHDSNYGDNSSNSGLPASVKNYVPTVQHPYILPDFGHAIMAGGSGTAQSQVHLHFSGTHGHEHFDNLNIILYAKGKELFSETAYESTADSTREWHTSTAGHNTVVIDQKSQPDTDYRTITSYDAIAEVSDYPLTADDFAGWHHLSMNKGNLRLWEVGHDPVQIAEASAERAYYPPTMLSTYRRTMSRIVSDGYDFYVVDIFRVKGGTIHDWMLHGNLEEAYTIETPLAMNTASGTIHSYISLSKSLTTANPLEFRFVAPGGQTVRTLMAPAAGTEAMIGLGPAMRRSGKAQFLDIRRRGASDVFAAVHEPYVGQGRVSQLTQLTPAAGSSTNAVALKIALTDRTDYFLSTMGPAEKAIVADGALNISLEGHAGFVSVRDGKVITLYLVDGAKLEAGGQTVTATCYNGTVTGSFSKTSMLRTPDAMNAFEVSDTALPVGTGLKGRTFLVTDGEGHTHGFEIDSIARNGSKTLVTLAADPGVKVAGGVYKMLYFPSWGVQGTVSYHVAGTAFWGSSPAPPLVQPYDNRLTDRTPTTVYGASTFLDVGHLVSSDKKYRDLIWFDLSPYSGSVKQAILSLYWYYPPSATRTNSTIVDIYRPATAGWDHAYACWTNKASGTAWTNAGGDWFDKNGTAQGSVPYASVTLNAAQVPDNKYYSFDVTALVNEYLASGQNAGFFIKARVENDNYIAFYGLSATDSATRPTLSVVTGGNRATALDWTCYE